MVPVPDAITGKHTMMISFQDAHITNIAMPRTRWNNELTLCAQVPVFGRRIGFEPRYRHDFISSEDT